jgi:hypothetical protein
MEGIGHRIDRLGYFAQIENGAEKKIFETHRSPEVCFFSAFTARLVQSRSLAKDPPYSANNHRLITDHVRK